MILVLFDIDGTLLSIPGAGREAFQKSLKAIFDLEVDEQVLNFSGATDYGILTTLVPKVGPIEGEQAQRFFQRLAEELVRALPQYPARVLPGVGALLKRISGEPENYTLALATGNTRAGACAKLAHGALDSYFRDAPGGFGDDSGERAKIVETAMARARDQGIEFNRVILLGDTPNDIQAARANEIPCIAVSTGRVSFEKLQAHEPEACFLDFSETEVVMEKIHQLTQEA